MKFKADEIASVIKEEISRYQTQLDVAEVGRVLEVGDGVARIFGLSKAMGGEMLQFASGAVGVVFNLEENSIGAVVLGDFLAANPVSGNERSVSHDSWHFRLLVAL